MTSEEMPNTVRRIRLAIVTHIPAPYRVPVYDEVAQSPGIELHAFYCAKREPDGEWSLPALQHAHTFLRPGLYSVGGRFIHNNADIWRRLREFAPNVIVTTGYNPTQLYAVAFALWHGVQHVPMTDGTNVSEQRLSVWHRMVRRFVLRRARTFIVASDGGRRLFKQYGVPDHRIHSSPLCANTSVDWAAYGANAAACELGADELVQDEMEQALCRVDPYSFKIAAAGIVTATRMAVAPHVLCLQRRLTHYRVPFFELLRVALQADGVEFDLVHGQPNEAEASKKDAGRIGWAQFVPNRYWLNGSICWQNPKRLARNVDLLVVTHENKMLFNLWATFWRIPRRLAYWGHGRNFQSPGRTGLRDLFKQWTARHVDWWFAYTSLSVQAVARAGMPVDHITNLENTIDTADLANVCSQIGAADTRILRRSLELGDGPLGVYIGSLYEEKRIAFLLEAAKQVAERVPGFKLLVAGDGPERFLVEKWLPDAPWLRYVGVVHGRDKAVLLKSARAFLNPGLVGLGILDAFVAGLPLVTTDCDLHSPEIDYLRHGQNGLMTANELEPFVQAVVGLMCEDALWQRLGAAAQQDAAHYTLENMVRNFRNGVLAALQLPVR